MLLHAHFPNLTGVSLHRFGRREGIEQPSGDLRILCHARPVKHQSHLLQFPKQPLGAKELERQARENNTYGAYGECYFEAKAYLADQISVAAKQTVYRNEAIPMFLDPDASVTAVLDYMIGRIDDIIVPFEGMTEPEADAVKKAIVSAKDNPSQKALTKAEEAIAKVKNEQAKQVLLKDLERAQRIVNMTQPSTEESGSWSLFGWFTSLIDAIKQLWQWLF